MQREFTTQDYGYMLITVGTFLAVFALVLGLAYLIWMAIPVKVEIPPPAPVRRPQQPLPPRMPAQRTHYTPRHQKALTAPQDPWLHSANTEIR